MISELALYSQDDVNFNVVHIKLSEKQCLKTVGRSFTYIPYKRSPWDVTFRKQGLWQLLIFSEDLGGGVIRDYDCDFPALFFSVKRERLSTHPYFLETEFLEHVATFHKRVKKISYQFGFTPVSPHAEFITFKFATRSLLICRVRFIGSPSSLTHKKQVFIDLKC